MNNHIDASIGGAPDQRVLRAELLPDTPRHHSPARAALATTAPTHHFLRARPFAAASRRETPAANLGTRLAGILISDPVWGFRPVLALRCTDEKVPKPTSVTFSPFLMASTTHSCIQFNAFSACPLVMLAVLAIAETSSALFIHASLFRGFHVGTASQRQCSRSFLHNCWLDVKRKCGFGAGGEVVKGVNTALRSREIVERVHWPTIFMHLEMHMWAGRAPATATEADDLTSFNGLAHVDEEPRVVGIEGRIAVHMLELHRFAVGPVVAGKHDNPVVRRLHRGAHRDGDVDAGMKLRRSSPHHVVAGAKQRGQRALDWPMDEKALSAILVSARRRLPGECLGREMAA